VPRPTASVTSCFMLPRFRREVRLLDPLLHVTQDFQPDGTIQFVEFLILI
jgi:hypothetical protein